MSAVVSVIIPNYNHASYLDEAIRSALAQTYPHVEVIVVDDGSTDDSRTVAARYGDDITYIWQENQGLSAARNTGIRAASGDYIALLDADDLLEPGYLAALMATLEEHPEASGAYCGYRFVDQHNCLLPQVENRTPPPEQLSALLLKGNFWVPESPVVQRRCYEEAGPFDTSLRACEDWDMWLRFSRRWTLVGIPDILIRYRVVVGSMSSDPARMLANRLVVLNKHVGPEPHGLGADPEASEAYARAYLRTAIEYLQTGDHGNVQRCLRRAAELHEPLMHELATFYELSLGAQPRGYRGNPQELRLVESSAIMFALLDHLLRDPQLPAAARRSQIYATAHLALAHLHYQVGDSPSARRHLVQVSKHVPSMALRPAYMRLAVRAVVGAGNVRYLKEKLGRGQGSG